RDLAGMTEGMVGSHIAFICKRAVMLTIAELIDGRLEKTPDALLVSAAHFKEALKELRESDASQAQGGVIQVLRFQKNE
ncbi:MAG: hypothetical protein ACD_75C02585G0001, partial [uncultured bacterium]